MHVFLQLEKPHFQVLLTRNVIKLANRPKIVVVPHPRKQPVLPNLEAVLRQRGGKILESCELFDIYEGSQIQAGYKSMAYSLVFRHKEKTLEEAEITAAMKKILNGLEGLGIELRS